MVSLLTFASFAVLLACLVIVRNQVPWDVPVSLDFPFQFLIGSLALNVASCSTFPILVFFGQDPHFSSNTKSLMIALVVISFFLFYGGLIFWSLEGWPYEEAVMFCLVTITSIGYGNRVPTKTSTRLIVIFGAMMGLAFIGFAIEQFRLLLVEDVAKRIAKQVKKIKNKVAQDGPPPEDEEDEEDRGFVKGRLAIFALWGKRSGAILGLISWWLCGSAIFMKLEGWDFFSSFYFAFVTLSTIGYGDLYPTSAGGMIFLIFYSLTGLGLFAFGLSTLSDGTSGQLDSQLDNLWGVVNKTQSLGLKSMNTMMSGGAGLGNMAKDLFGKGEKDPILALVKSTSVLGTSVGLPTALEDEKMREEREKREAEENAKREKEEREEAERKAREEEAKKPKDAFTILNKEQFDELSQAVAKSLKKLQTCEPTAVDAWLRDYRKKKEQFEATFAVRDPAEVAAELAEKEAKEKETLTKEKRKREKSDDGEVVEPKGEKEEEKDRKDKKDKKHGDEEKGERKKERRESKSRDTEDHKEHRKKSRTSDDPPRKRSKVGREGDTVIEMGDA